MERRVVIAGASGFIGTALVRFYRDAGAAVTTIGRGGSADARWGDPAAITRLVDGADVVINLAGRTVDCRYTAKNRSEILHSRVDTTRQLHDAIRASAVPPRLWINSSTATIYRHADDRPMTESTGEIGTGFSVSVATAWEEAFFAGSLPSTRRVALRMAIVLGDGSALVPLIRLARFGLGGPQLDGRWFTTAARRAAGTFHDYRARSRGGRQRFSWVHIDDVVGTIEFIDEYDGIDGAINVSSPHPSDNRTFMKTLREVLGVRLALPAPRWVLELGTAVIRSETELVLKSRWVLPERLLNAGYDFRQPQLGSALQSIVAQRRLPQPDSPG